MNCCWTFGRTIEDILHLSLLFFVLRAEKGSGVFSLPKPRPLTCRACPDIFHAVVPVTLQVPELLALLWENSLCQGRKPKCALCPRSAFILGLSRVTIPWFCPQRGSRNNWGGILEYWNIGILEYWGGILEYWNIRMFLPSCLWFAIPRLVTAASSHPWRSSQNIPLSSFPTLFCSPLQPSCSVCSVSVVWFGWAPSHMLSDLGPFFCHAFGNIKTLAQGLQGQREANKIFYLVCRCSASFIKPVTILSHSLISQITSACSTR